MRLGRRAAAAAGAGTLVAALAVATVPPAAVTAAPAALHSPGSLRQVPATAQCEADFGVACYQPLQLQRAYDLGPLYAQGVTGRGVTIAIVDSFGSPTIQADLAAFDQALGLPAPPSFTVIQPAGAVPPYDPADADMVGWAGETTLDVEYAHAIAPGASILLVETPVSESEGVTGFPQIVQAEEYVIDHQLGDVISQSFSAAEQTFAARDAVEALRGAYTDADAHQVTVLSSTGDSGAANVGRDGQTYLTAPTTTWPPSDPLVTAVGGTQLHLDASGQRTSPDTVWNDTDSIPASQFVFGDDGPHPLATGSGLSALFSRPSYQDPVRAVVGDRRGVPDISMSAACDGAVDVYHTFAGQAPGWRQTCGTSEAVPLFAGIVALADQVAHHRLGLINPALYQMSARHLPGLIDVTSGDTTVTVEAGGQPVTVPGNAAGPGYDLASGVGTVNAAQFVPELAQLAGH